MGGPKDDFREFNFVSSWSDEMEIDFGEGVKGLNLLPKELVDDLREG
jgi:hypothetical protein